MASEFQRGYLYGVAKALAAIYVDNVYDKVMKSLDADELIAQARKDGNMKWSGLSRYLRRHRGE